MGSNNNKAPSGNTDYYRNNTTSTSNKDNSHAKRQKTNNHRDQQSNSNSSSLDYYGRSSNRRNDTSTINASSSRTNSNNNSNRWGKQEEFDDDKSKTEEQQQPKSLPDFALSGALSKDTMNKNNESIIYNGIKLKFSEPADAKIPKSSSTQWRLYVFKPNKDATKDAELLEVLPITRQSAYLFGREKAVADILVEHSSLSRQHCVLQCKFFLFVLCQINVFIN